MSVPDMASQGRLREHCCRLIGCGLRSSRLVFLHVLVQHGKRMQSTGSSKAMHFSKGPVSRRLRLAER